MGVQVELRFNLLEPLAGALAGEAGEIVETTARVIEESARQAILSPPKTGRVYRSRTKPSPHQASAPGEAPADWTGELQRSLTTERTGRLAAVVKVAARHGARLELGGRGVAPRPFLRPAAEAARPEFESAMRELADRARRKVGG